MTAGFRIFLVRLKYSHDATETLRNPVGLLSFDFDFFLLAIIFRVTN